jgi:hypothetical protein
MRACFHWILIGKIDRLKPVLPVAAILFLLAGHHQFSRAYFSVAIIVFSPRHGHQSRSTPRNIKKRSKNKTSFSRAHFSLAMITYSMRAGPQPQALVVSDKHAKKAEKNKSLDNQSEFFNHRILQSFSFP